MPGLKTNERPGTRAVLRHHGASASKVRQVLDLIRGEDVDRASEILRATPRDAAITVGKVLASAVANAIHNDGLDAEDLYVSACFADEATTAKRWRPRARGRATRIRKRSCHITIIVSRLPDDRLARRRSERDASSGRRSRRGAESRRRADLSGRLVRRRAAQADAEARREEEEASSESEEGLLDEDVLDEDVEATEVIDVLDDGDAGEAEDDIEGAEADLDDEADDEEEDE